jgi:hypothetical protein
MLGLVGNRYAELSGTAFSLVLTVGLIGNMLVNYIMGIIASKSGMNHMITIDFVELAILALLATIIFRKLNFQTIKH